MHTGRKPANSLELREGISRRSWLKSVSIASLACAADTAFGYASVLHESAEKAPNFLFISIEDLNDWVGFLGGHPQAKTPHLDALAAKSVVFENAVTPATVCFPCRIAVLTGVAPHVSGIYSNPDTSEKPFEGFRSFYPQLKDVVTLPKHMTNNGYYTICQGAVFDYPLYEKDEWDEWHYSPWDKCAPDPMPGSGMQELYDNSHGNFDWGPVAGCTKEDIKDYMNATAAGELLRTYDGEKPFFIACGLDKPHIPLYAPQEYFDMFPLESIQLPPVIKNDLDDICLDPPEVCKQKVGANRTYVDMEPGGEIKKKEAVRGYLATTAFMDDCIGKMLEGLEAGPHAGNTIVIIWSDHGFNMGEKERYGKANLWEECTRVPLLICAPGMPAMGTRCKRPVSLQDLYNTITELAGVPRNGAVFGRSLKPLLLDSKTEWPWPALSVIGGPGRYSLRTEQYHYIQHPQGGEELYDHDVDPHEWDNCAYKAEYQTVKEEIKKHLPPSTTEAKPVGPAGNHKLLSFGRHGIHQRTSSLSITASMPAAGRMQVRAYNTRGALVAQLAGGDFTKGVHRFHWDWRDSTGKRVAAHQAYIIELKAVAAGRTIREYERIVHY